MTLAPGFKLGPYEVLAPLGAGGMGEVYKAKDTRLDREVAVKVLPSHLASSPELRQRFEREAKAISALTHPHICTLYDVGNQDGVEYLVMELLEGDSLAERLSKGELPPEQVLKFGIEIAEALEAAHRHDIVHRDLKPGNIMLTKSGVKLLDFGLAKHRTAAVDKEISQLSSMPTEASPSRPLTEQGSIMGTFQYMSPEQLEGRDADVRTDIFAFGCVLYEMATGRKAFFGKSRASLIGAILKDEPAPISSIAPMTPPALDRVVKTCLAKEADDRFQTAHDVKLQLQWIVEGGSQAGAPAVVVARRKSRERLAWVSAGVFLLAAALLAVGFLRRAPKPGHTVRFQLESPDGLATIGSPRMSPDGRFIAFSATDVKGVTQLWIRPLDALETRAIPGTEGASFRPFWSPDSRFIGFVAEGKLKKVDVAGGPPQTICDAVGAADGSWGKDGVILFDGTSSDPIRRVSAAGGTPQTAITLDTKGGNASIGWPDFLPDGRHFLYLTFGGQVQTSSLMVADLDSKKPPEKILTVGSRVQFAPPDYLLYVREGSLLAQRFDASARRIVGEPIPLADKLGIGLSGLADFSSSSDGTLVYRGGETGANRLLWFDRAGKEISEADNPATYRNTSLSPDGKSLAMEIRDPKTDKSDIWVRDLARGVTSRFTFGGSNNAAPLWTADGRRIIFGSNRKGPLSLYIKDASGTGPEEELFFSGEPMNPGDASRDGRFLAVNRRSSKTNFDIWILPLDGKAKPFPFVQTPFLEVDPSFSPDGHFIAYMSDESGRFEIYVQQFPGPGGKWQLSTEGGTEPHWSGDGKEIFYVSAGSKIMSVPVATGASLTVGIPKALFDARLQPAQQRNRFLATRDGSRFLILSPLAKDRVLPMTVVLNWAAALRN